MSFSTKDPSHTFEDDRIAWPPPGYRTTGIKDLDAPVQSTHLDAAGAKKICADIGYFEDKVLKDLVPNYVCTRKSPMIHRGYYCRTMAMRRGAERFIRSIVEAETSDSGSGNNSCSRNMPIQIVNLGGGLDTLYFWVRDNIESWGKSKEDLTFFEVDFPVVVSKKTGTMMRKGIVKDLEGLGTQSVDANGVSVSAQTTRSPLHEVEQIYTRPYRLIACDMRQTEELKQGLFNSGFNQMAHTLFLSECVLVYLQPEYGDQIIKTCREIVSPSNNVLSMFLTYEQFNPGTRFGKEMVKNLAARGCPLLACTKYGTKEEIVERYRMLGWGQQCQQSESDHTNGIKCWTLNEHYDRTMTEQEIQRVSKLEMLDELEEFRLIQDHYMILLAINGGRGWDVDKLY